MDHRPATHTSKPTFIMKKTLAIPVLLIAALAACRKDPTAVTPTPTPVPDPVATGANLEISLNDTYLPASKIDSALAVWETAGTIETVALQWSGNKLVTRSSNFKKAGNGMLTVQLFTQTTVDGKPLQWERRFAHTLTFSTPLLLVAPTSFTDAAWQPRMVCRSQIDGAGATTIFGLRPDDAYFELKGVDPYIAKRIVVERSFHLNGLTDTVVVKTWVGDKANLDAGGNLLNRTYFASLLTQLGNRPWNKYVVKAQYYAQINPARVFESEFILDKP